MNRRESFKAMNTNVVVLPKRDLNYKLKLVSNEDWAKRFEFFWALAREKTQMRHDLPSFLSRNLCGWLLFFHDPFSVCFLELFVFLSLVALRCLFFFSFAFLSPFSTYFSVLSNFLARFSRLAWYLLLLAFFGRSVSFGIRVCALHCDLAVSPGAH